MKKTTGKIGIGITTHNRTEVFKRTYANIVRYAPTGAKIVVVDDASDIPVRVNKLAHRFDKNVGIATAKNKCLELLEDCEHIFLFDDDCYPKVKGWEEPYIASPEPHLMYLFLNLRNHQLNDAKLVYEDEQHYVISHARGCMLYFHRSVLDVAGGMDTTYGKWGYEHGDLSNRIYNLGLTSFRYMDVAGSEALIYSEDQEQAVSSSVKGQIRHRNIVGHKDKFAASFSSAAYFPYKEGAKPMDLKSGKEKVVITSYFNALPDAQRKGKTWEADYTKLDALRLSVTDHKRPLVIINNCFRKRDTALVKHHRVSQGVNPYFQRWLSQWQYLRSHPEIGQVFLTDATDVVMLHDPFSHLEAGKLYVGDEKAKVGCPWMRHAAVSQRMKQFVARFYKYPLFNCGVVGGSREDVMRLCRQVYEAYFEKHPEETVEMPIFNQVLYTLWDLAKVESGRKVTTVFKKQEKVSTAWFKHK